MGLRKRRVMLVEDYVMVRQGMAALINYEPDLLVVAEAGDAKSALDVLAIAPPMDIVLLDLALGNSANVCLIQEMRCLVPDLPLLVVSMHNENVYAEQVLKLGARGYIMKQAPAEELLKAIRHVMKGHIYLSAAMTSILLKNVIGFPAAAKQSQELTQCEYEVLQLIAAGRSSVEIAKLKNRSVKTVESHRANIRTKLHLKDGADLIRYATLHFPPLTSTP